MGIDRLIRSLIAWGMTLGVLGTLDEVNHHLTHEAAKPRMLSLVKLNHMLLRGK